MALLQLLAYCTGEGSVWRRRGEGGGKGSRKEGEGKGEEGGGGGEDKTMKGEMKKEWRERVQR